MKTPDEIKKGLKCCVIENHDCGNCPYRTDCITGTDSPGVDALRYINDLEAAHRTEYCEEADYDCAELGKARKRIKKLETRIKKLEMQIKKPETRKNLRPRKWRRTSL